KLQRRGAGAALATIDGDEVGSDAGVEHGSADGKKVADAAHAELHAYGLAVGQLAHSANELHQLGRRGKSAVRRRRDTGLSHRHAAGFGDFAAHLGGRQNPARAGFGALRELELDHADAFSGRDLLEPLRVEPTLWSAAAEVAAADLPDQIATMLQMVARDPAF